MGKSLSVLKFERNMWLMISLILMVCSFYLVSLRETTLSVIVASVTCLAIQIFNRKKIELRKMKVFITDLEEENSNNMDN